MKMEVCKPCSAQVHTETGGQQDQARRRMGRGSWARTGLWAQLAGPFTLRNDCFSLLVDFTRITFHHLVPFVVFYLQQSGYPSI